MNLTVKEPPYLSWQKLQYGTLESYLREDVGAIPTRGKFLKNSHAVHDRTLIKNLVKRITGFYKFDFANDRKISWMAKNFLERCDIELGIGNLQEVFFEIDTGKTEILNKYDQSMYPKTKSHGISVK